MCKYLLFLFILCGVFIQQNSAQILQRKIWFGAIIHEQHNELVVDSIIRGSSADVMKLKKNDILLSVNGVKVDRMALLNQLLQPIRANDSWQLSYKRNKKITHCKNKAIGQPLFEASWCNTNYSSLKTTECEVRTILYLPKHKLNPPVILFIPGYNCSSIESFSGNFNGQLISYWVSHGYAVYTVEKSGLGDSYACKPCQEVDLHADIEVYETALNALSQHKLIDPSRIYIWGHSMGGIIAPMIAQHKSIKGIMVFGTVFRPWSEFLLEMHRVQKPLLDSLSFTETEDFVRLIQQVYYEFFVLKKSPEVLYKNPLYKKVVEEELEYSEGKEDMWGRHWRFWQQLDSINLAKAWQEINCPVLVLQGSSDFIQCSAVEPYLIAEAVNQAHPNQATLFTLPQIDHLMMNSISFKEAVVHTKNKEYLDGNFNPIIAETTLEWLNKNL
ncbi:MAG: alpha/beta fold hydrolase [Chitinophagaceae bacterium]|nr:alpha/beta fold hydrolase [Chitinophagaceae bacterium]